MSLKSNIKNILLSGKQYADARILDLASAMDTALDGKVDKVTGKDLSSNDYTTTEKDKLSGIASGAEVNVQSDWEQTDSNSDDYIKNKPVISGEDNVQSDWCEEDESADSYIQDKPRIITFTEINTPTDIPEEAKSNEIFYILEE